MRRDRLLTPLQRRRDRFAQKVGKLAGMDKPDAANFAVSGT
jgi:hypothetical protein